MAEVTNKDLYDAINSLRNEFSGSVQRLDDRLSVMESGRLARLESDITNLKVAQATTGTKLYILVGIISSAISIIGSAVAGWVFAR